MKKLGKILMLMLVVALTLGCVFAIATSAADEPVGVSTVHDVDFTGATNFPWADAHGIGVPHVATSADGNSYFEWSFYTAPGMVADARYQSFLNQIWESDYYVIEFDIATATTLPDNFGLHFLCNAYDPATDSEVREGAGIYSPIIVSAGQLTTGGKVIPVNENSEWTHITLVFDGVQEAKTYDYIDETGVAAVRDYTSYDNTTVNVYADGVLVSSSQPWVGKNVRNIRRNYIGWNYRATTPITAGESVAIDNWVQINCVDYLGTGEADLGQLFDGTVTNLTDYNGTELKLNANGYTYPPAMGNVYVETLNGNVTYKTVQDAINAIANRKVQGDIHLVNAEGVVAEDGTFTGLPSANVTVPVTIYTHGKAIAKPTVVGAVIETVGEDDMGETVYTYERDQYSVTFEYYATMEDYDDVIPMSVVDVKVGQIPTAPVIGDVYDKESGKVTLFKGWHYYDVEGNELGAEMPVFTEADYGITYCAVAVTETVDVLFYTILGDEINYYASASDFTSANLAGKTVVLAGNITMTETLANPTIDLNGYTLDGGTLNMFNNGFVYSSAEGGKILSQGTLHQTDAGDKLYLGYISEETKSDYRITLVVKSIAPARNDKTYMYGCDVFTTYELVPSVDKNGGALFNNQQTRVKIVDIDSCNFYCGTYTHIFSQHAMTGTYTINIKNTNFYGKGSLISQHVYNTAEGVTVANLENVHTYGEFAMTGSTTFKLNVGVGCSFANYNAQNVNSIASGYWVVETDAKVTLADQTYVTTIGGETLTFAGGEFAVGNVVEEAPVKATFNFYDVDIADVVTATPISTQTKYLGEIPTAPTIASKQEGGKFYNCVGWIVYDGETELGALSAVTEEMNDKTLYVCPVWEEVEVAFAVVEGETETMYPAASFTSAVVTGKKVKLYADVTVTEQITFANVDLNGYTINFTADVAFAQGSTFIYNTNTETEGHANFADGIYSWGQESAARKIYFGYSADGVKEEGRIVLTAGYFFGGKNTNYAFLYNVDYINLKAHDISRDSDTVFYEQLRSMTVNIDNCNFYCVEPLNMIGANQTAPASVFVAISNTNFYGNGAIFGAVSNARAGDNTATLINVKMYGGFRVFGNGGSMSWANAGMSVSLDENCLVSATMDKEILPAGYILVPSTEKVTLDKTFAMADGTVYEMKGEYAADLKVGTEADLPSTSTVITVYDKAYGTEGATSSEIVANVGDTIDFPAADSYQIGNVVYTPTGEYAVYDAAGELIYTGIALVVDQAVVSAGPCIAYPIVEETVIQYAFATVENGVETRYYASDFTAANVDGKTVKLYDNIVLTETLTNVTLDLNGYTLDGGTLNMFNGGFVYSSAEGGKLLSQGNIHATDAGDSVYLGYVNSTTKSDCRIILVVKSIAPARNDKTYMYGCDVFTTYEWTSGDRNNGALFFNAQSRVKIVDIDSCNFYCGTYTHIFSQHAMTGSYTINIKNTNFYGKGSLISSVIYNTNEGAAVANLENVHTYGEFAMTGSTTFKLNVGVGCSFANYNAQNVNSIASGYWVVETDAKVTLADQTYVTTIGGETLTFAGGEFAVGNVVEKAPVKATFNFYDVAIGDVVTATPISTQTKYLGETPTAPTIASKQEGGKFYNCVGWIVYDGETELGALGAVTEEMNNKTLYVCPVWEEVEIAFAVVNGDVETMCAASDFNQAFLQGKKIKLYSDITFNGTAPLINATIDLNGYTIVAETTLISASGKCYVYNSNTETSATIEAKGNLAGGGEGTNLNIGYSASGVKAEGRITMSVAGMMIDTRSFTANLYNVDYVGKVAHAVRTSLFFSSWGRTSVINIEGCNLYMLETTNLIRGDQANSAIDINVKDTKIYGSGYFVAVLDKVTTGGAIDLDNVQIYGNFGFQIWQPYWMTVTITEDCVISTPEQTVTGSVVLPEGKVLVPSTEKVTLDKTFVMADGTVYEMKGEYAASLKVGTADELASYRTVIVVYDKAYGVEGANDAYTTAFGFEEVYVFPALDAYRIGSYLYTPTGEFEVYNEAGELVYTGTSITFDLDTLAAGPYSAYPVVEESESLPYAFSITVDGEETLYYAADFTAANVDGKAVKLYDNIVLTETLTNVTLDLNGYTLDGGTLNMFNGGFVYSSAEGGKILSQGALHQTDAGDKLYLGYISEETKSDYRITLVVKSIAPVRNDKTYMYACDVFTTYEWTSGDRNNGALFNNSQSRVKIVDIDSCNFYCATYTHIFSQHAMTGSYTITISNTNFYGKGSLISSVVYNTNDGAAIATLENVHTYGEFRMAGSNTILLDIGAGCSFASVPEADNINSIAGGTVFVPASGSVVLEDMTYTTTIGGEALTFGGTFVYSVAVGSISDLEDVYASFYRNVNLDTSINFNLYIPIVYAVAGATETATINGVECWVVTVKTAPKDALGDNVIAVTVNGLVCRYNASIVNYVKALNKMDSSDYYTASKQMAKYVLYYIKTAALNAYGDADTSAVDALLGNFALTEEDKAVTGAIENVSGIEGIVGATLDLSSRVGLVFKVNAGYNGTLNVTFNGQTTVYDYTETAATDDTYIVIADIAAYDFTKDVTITGGTETMTYNLATYVVNTQTEIGYAAYAYAKQAKVYNDTYGNPAN